MLTSLRILTFAFGISLTCSVSAMQPAYNYSDKTVAELLELLKNKDSTVRHCAAIFLGERYRNPKSMVHSQAQQSITRVSHTGAGGSPSRRALEVRS